MKADEQGMAGRLARLEANINAGYPKRLALTMASNQPGDLDMGGMGGGMEAMPMAPLRRRRRKRGMGVSVPKVRLSKPRRKR